MKNVITFSAWVIFVLAVSANAVTVNYTVSGWGATQFPSAISVPEGAPWGQNGYPGDTVEFQTYTGSLDLTLGIYTQKINTLLWTIDYTYGGTPEPWPDITFDFAAPRTMSIDAGPADVLNQTGHLVVNYYTDYFSLVGGSSTSFIVQGYQVTVTPLALSAAEGAFEGWNPWVQQSRDVMATFVVSEIPEPATMVLLGLGGLLLRKRK